MLAVTVCCDRQGVIRRLSHLQDNITDAEHQQALQLSASRNLLLKSDLFISVTTLFVTVGAMVTGIFGMNLNSNVQDDPSWFTNVVILICVGVFICVAVSFSLLNMFLRT